MKELIDELSYDLAECHKDYLDDAKLYTDYDTMAQKLISRCYRRQSEDMVDIATIKKWLYQIAINNVGYVLDGDCSTACEEIISRLDGLKRFAKDMKGADDGKE